MAGLPEGAQADAAHLVGPALAALERERPDIAVAPVRLADMGFSSYVLTTGSGYVVRVARTPEAADGHRRECELLPRLARLLPVAVPLPVWRLPAGPASRFGAMAYHRIEGTTLGRDTHHPRRVVAQLAGLLAQVHRLGVEQVTSGVVAFTEWKHAVISSAGTAVDHLRDELPTAEHQRLRRWREQFVGHVDDLPPRGAVVVHGDFWHDNILARGTKVVGMLDWEAAAVADPAVDLAPVWDIDHALGAGLVEGYQRLVGPDPSLADRVRLFRIARNVCGITWCLDNNDHEEYVDSLTKVQDVLPLT